MSEPPRVRPWHRGLDHTAIVTEALHILDSEGRGALTMRRLASALDVEAASLYAHIRNKDALVDAVLDAVLESVVVPEATEDVGASLIEGFTSYRRTLLAHPPVVLLMTERATQSRTQLRLAERSIVLLETAGLSTRQAIDTHVTLIAFTLGFILQEVSRPTAPPDLEAVTPIIRRALVVLAERPVDDRFRVGLEVILYGAGVSSRRV